MTNFQDRAAGPQIEAAAEIERETMRLKEIALRTNLRFLCYLIDMAHDEAAVIAAGRRGQTDDM
jgi:hypothetical protein